MKKILILLAGLASWGALGQTPVATTPYTRAWLRSTNAGVARSGLGLSVTNIGVALKPGLSQFTTNESDFWLKSGITITNASITNAAYVFATNLYGRGSAISNLPVLGGTAITDTQFTTNGNVLALKSGGVLPAMDGSALTGVAAEAVLGGTDINTDQFATNSNVLELKVGGTLPAMDGSALTGISATVDVGDSEIGGVGLTNGVVTADTISTDSLNVDTMYVTNMYGSGAGLDVATAAVNGILSTNIYSLVESFKTKAAQMRKPPRGWVTWGEGGTAGATSNKVYECMDSYDAWGLREYGWTYMQVDDGAFLTTRDVYGKLQVNPTNFNGATSLRPLSDYVHGRGYHLGLLAQWPYANGTSYMIPVHLGYEEADAYQISHDWQVDGVQFDIIVGPVGYTAAKDNMHRYVAGLIAKGFRKSDYPTFFKSSFGWNTNGQFLGWMPELLNQGCMGDVNAEADTVYDPTLGVGHGRYQAMLEFLDRAYTHKAGVGNGYIADPDRCQLGVWGNDALLPKALGVSMHHTDLGIKAMLSAPLINYHNLVGLGWAYWEPFITCYTNLDMIAIQENGYMASILSSNALVLTYVKQMDQERWAVAFNNRVTNSASSFTLYLTNLGYTATEPIVVRDVWYRTNLGTFTGSFTVSVPAADTYLYLTTPARPVTLAERDIYPDNSTVRNLLRVNGTDAANLVPTIIATATYGLTPNFVATNSGDGSYAAFGSAGVGSAYGGLQFHSGHPKNTMSYTWNSIWGNSNQTVINVPNSDAGGSGIQFRANGTEFARFTPSGMYGNATGLTNFNFLLSATNTAPLNGTTPYSWVKFTTPQGEELRIPVYK